MATRRSFITTEAYQSEIFTYSVRTDGRTGKTTGTLTTFAAGGKTAADCPIAAVLHESGKRLFPGANPGVKTLMIGVFNPVSMASGFINPNAKVFAPLTDDRPTYLPVPVDAVDGVTKSQGPPVFTSGLVALDGLVSVGGSITANGPIRSSSVTQVVLGAAATTATIDLSKSNIFVITTNATSTANLAIMLTASNVSENVGQQITIILKKALANSISLTFGSNMYELMIPGGAGGTTPTAQNLQVSTGYPAASASFVSDGDNMYEVCRSSGINMA